MGTLINLDIYLATLEEDCELKQFNFKFTDKDERGTISFIHDIDMEYIDPLVDAVEFIIAIFNPTNLEDKIKTDDVEWMFGDDTTIVIANDETKESVKITFGSKNRKMNATINLNNDQTYITNMGGMIKDNAISMHSSFLIKLKCPTIYEQFFNNLCVFDYNDRIVAVSDMELLYTEYNVSDMGRSLSKKYGELVGGMVFVGLHEHMIIVTNLDKEEINDAESIVGILVKVIPKHHMKSVHLVNCPPTEDEDGNSCIRIADEEVETVREILANPPAFIDRPEDESYFQRKYGVGITHRKDTRNLAKAEANAMKLIKESNIRNSFIKLSLQRPIYAIDNAMIDEMVQDLNGLYTFSEVEDVVRRCYPGGAPSGFYSNYYQMAFEGKDHATDFEKATETVFRDVFGFQTEHIGQKGKVPDVVISTDSEGYQAIIDAKAYSSYTLNHDHFNRMVHTYIPELHRYSFSRQPLAAFCYIAGGFGNTMSNWLKDVEDTTGTSGSAFTIRTIISMAEAQKDNPMSHATWKTLLTSGQVYTPDKLHLTTSKR